MQEGISEAVIRRRTDNTMAKGEMIKGQTRYNIYLEYMITGLCIHVANFRWFLKI
jgi:hypothetical protein